MKSLLTLLKTVPTIGEMWIRCDGSPAYSVEIKNVRDDCVHFKIAGRTYVNTTDVFMIRYRFRK